MWWYTLTSWRVLQHTAVVVAAGRNLQLTASNGLTDGAAGNDLDLAGIVLARLRNIEVIHAIIGELVALTLKRKDEIGVRRLFGRPW